MQQPNIDFLNEHYGIYDTLVKAGFIQHLDHSVRQRMLDITRMEFAPDYLTNLWCSSCVMAMIEYVYGQYNQWKARQVKEEPKKNKHHVRR